VGGSLRKDIRTGAGPQGHPHRRGHRHTIQEEVYFLVSSRAQGKFDGEVVDMAPWTAVPFDSAGKAKLDLFAAHCA
jgi:hypothetical protein